MTPSKPRQSLGRGLDALFGETAGDTADDPSAATGQNRQSKDLVALPIGQLFPSPLQPRRIFDDKQIDELAASIKDKGVLQPLLVRMVGNGYEIIAGERRWRAAQKAQVHQVPVVIKDLDDTEVLEVALVENLQRADLTPLEEAEGYQRLIDEFGHTQEMLGELIGKSRTHIANMIRLLGLPDGVKALLDNGSLSMGHARALLGVKDAVPLARKIVDEGLSVRQVENLVKTHGKPFRPRKASAKAPAVEKDADTRALESRLESALGLNVDISFDGKGGVLRLEYADLEQLDDLVDRLTMKKPTKPTLATSNSDTKDPNVLDIEEVLAKREGRTPILKEDHSGDAPAPGAHPDPEAGDIGSGGALNRDPAAEPTVPDPAWPEGHSEDVADDSVHPDPNAGDVGASGALDRDN